MLRDNPSTLDIAIDGLKLHSSIPSVQLDFGTFAQGYVLDPEEGREYFLIN